MVEDPLFVKKYGTPKGADLLVALCSAIGGRKMIIGGSGNDYGMLDALDRAEIEPIHIPNTMPDGFAIKHSLAHYMLYGDDNMMNDYIHG
jgi:hypothetical protein